MFLLDQRPHDHEALGHSSSSGLPLINTHPRDARVTVAVASVRFAWSAGSCLAEYPTITSAAAAESGEERGSNS